MGSPRGHGQVSGSPPDISSLRPVLRTQPVWHPLQGAQGLHPASCASLPVPQSAKRTNWPWLGHICSLQADPPDVVVTTPTYQPRARLHLHHVRALPRNAECAHLAAVKCESVESFFFLGCGLFSCLWKTLFLSCFFAGLWHSI